MKDLGQIIGVSGSTMSSIERGSSSPSLPELELLAFYLGTPIAHFWSDEIVSEELHPTETMETQKWLDLRHRTVGVLLRQARNQAGLSQKDLSEQTAISASRIRRYENGETPVPLPELEQMASALELQINQLTDLSGKIGEWITSQRAAREFAALPTEVKEFVADPCNRQYLQLAQQLKSISVEKLRSLAQALTDVLD